MRRHRLELGAQRVFARQVAETHSAAGDFVLIGRTDAAAGGADFTIATLAFTKTVQTLMQRQDQYRAIRQQQLVRRNRHALRLHLLDFGKQCPGIDHHPIADDRQLAAHHARGQQA